MLKTAKQIINKSYYKIWIISLFSLVTFLLILLMSLLSYNLVKDLYLAQKSEQVKRSSGIIAQQIDRSYLDLLELGKPTEGVRDYFLNIFENNLPEEDFPELFLFNRDFNVLIHRDSSRIDKFQPHLLLNKNEILNTEVGDNLTTIPFKGEDNKWYLWGFSRLNENIFLAYREDAQELESVEDISTIFLAIGLGGIIIAVLIGWFLSKTILNPLNRLSKFSEEIGKGKFFTEAPENLKGEIKNLADSMDKMKKDLKSNQEERERMLAQIAHEIRNPLGGIELLASLTREDLSSKNMDDSYPERILKEVQSLKNIINVYLDYSKPHLPEAEICSLREIADEMKMIFSADFEKKQIHFDTDFEEDKIRFDKRHIKQVVMNIVKNSIAAVDKNGKIKISSSKNSNYILVKFEDDGKGIVPEIRDKIFEPFYTTKAEGTGLGLSTCRKLCEENNAELFLENSHGTMFVIKKEVE